MPYQDLYVGSRPEEVMANAKSVRQNSAQLISFPANIGPHTMLMTFKTYKYENARAGEQQLLSLGEGFSQRAGAVAGSQRSEVQQRFSGQLLGIELPIPSNLRDTDNLRMEPITQTVGEMVAGSGIAAAAGALNSSNLTLAGIPGSIQQLGAQLANTDMNDLYSQGTSAANRIISDILNTSVSSASRDAVYLLRSTVDKYLPGASRVADRALGSTVNPKASLAFEGVELKQHSFNWTLSPKSKNESEILNNIIKTLKINSLPTYQTFTGTSFKAYLKYPSIVDIYLLGVNPDYFMKFKSSMIRSVNVEYGAGGLVSILKGGKPGNVNLNIDLVELDIHTAEDYGGQGGFVNQNAGEIQSALSDINRGISRGL